jgi:hypothetical protein
MSTPQRPWLTRVAPMVGTRGPVVKAVTARLHTAKAGRIPAGNDYREATTLLRRSNEMLMPAYACD